MAQIESTAHSTRVAIIAPIPHNFHDPYSTLLSKFQPSFRFISIDAPFSRDDESGNVITMQSIMRPKVLHMIMNRT